METHKLKNSINSNMKGIFKFPTRNSSKEELEEYIHELLKKEKLKTKNIFDQKYTTSIMIFYNPLTYSTSFRYNRNGTPHQ